MSHHTVKVRCLENQHLVDYYLVRRMSKPGKLVISVAGKLRHKASLSYTVKLREEEEESKREAVKAEAAAAKACSESSISSKT